MHNTEASASCRQAGLALSMNEQPHTLTRVQAAMRAIRTPAACNVSMEEDAQLRHVIARRWQRKNDNRRGAILCSDQRWLLTMQWMTAMLSASAFSQFSMDVTTLTSTPNGGAGKPGNLTSMTCGTLGAAG
jgi:hypothetical protein